MFLRIVQHIQNLGLIIAIFVIFVKEGEFCRFETSLHYPEWGYFQPIAQIVSNACRLMALTKLVMIHFITITQQRFQSRLAWEDVKDEMAYFQPRPALKLRVIMVCMSSNLNLLCKVLVHMVQCQLSKFKQILFEVVHFFSYNFPAYLQCAQVIRLLLHIYQNAWHLEKSRLRSAIE